MVRTMTFWESLLHHADPRRPYRDPSQPGALHVLADREGLRDRSAAQPGEAGSRRAASPLIFARPPAGASARSISAGGALPTTHLAMRAAVSAARTRCTGA